MNDNEKDAALEYIDELKAKINRQKAEIEKLSADIKTFENVIKRCFLQAAGG